MDERELEKTCFTGSLEEPSNFRNLKKFALISFTCSGALWAKSCSIGYFPFVFIIAALIN